MLAMNQLKIVLVDDHDEMRDNTKEILELDNYNVYQANNGKKGVRLIQKHIPDIIICDIMMPDLDGYGVLKIVRNNPLTKHIPFIFLTAKNEMKDMRIGMNLGADDYLAKPFTDIELLESISIRLERASAIKTNAQIETELNQLLHTAKATTNLEIKSDRWTKASFKKGDYIYRDGSFPENVYLLQSGKVKLSKKNNTGKELLLSVKNESSFFGYKACIADQKHNTNAKCITDVNLLCINRKDFQTILFSEKHLCKSFIRLIAKDVESLENQLLSMAYSSVKKRIIETLLTLYKAENKPSKSIKIKRTQLASMAGTVKETAIRTLKDLEEEGLININYSTIEFVNISGLRQLVSTKVI